jgi:hypothetical protein
VVQLVPLDLIRRHDRHQIVDVRRRRDEHGKGRPAVPAQGAPAAARAHGLPGRDREAGAGQLLDRLAEHHAAHVVETLGQARGAVGERGEVRLGGEGAGVQAGRRVEVRLLEAADANVAARAQEAVIGADVEIDLVGGRPRGLPIHDSPYLRWQS